jgi:uncharacterized membrane protein YfcA
MELRALGPRVNVGALMIVGFPFVGAIAGLISAGLGVGGGWLVTPFLLCLGRPPHDVVGTSLAFMAITSWSGVREHVRQGNLRAVPRNSILALILGTLIGTESGRATLRALERLGWAPILLRTTLMVAFGFLGWQWLWGSVPVSRPPGLPAPGQRTRPSALGLVFLGFLGGWVGGMAGLGGGTIVVPLLVNVVECSPSVAVPMSLCAVGVGALWGTVRYAWCGHVDWVGALGLGLGAWLVSGIGARAVTRLPREMFAKWFGALLWLTAGGVALGGAGWKRAALGGILLGATALAGAMVVSVKHRPSSVHEPA